MRIDWRNDPNATTPCRVIDKGTGKQILLCAMADEETGEYEQYVLDGPIPPDGRPRFVIDPKTKCVALHSGHANLEIVVLQPGEPYIVENKS